MYTVRGLDIMENINLKEKFNQFPVVGKEVFDYVKKQAYSSGEDNALVEIVELALISFDQSNLTRKSNVVAIMGVNADKDMIHYINGPNYLLMINGKMHAEAVPADIIAADIKKITAYETLKSYLG
jgi:hypothetical protein